MRYKVALQRSEEGVAVWVPGLPGCWSQGANEVEAVENIKAAIADYLAVASDLPEGAELRRSRSCRLMPKLPGVNHLQAVKVFEKAGFIVARQSSHIVMKRARDQRILTIPRHNPINAITMGGLIRDAGLTIDEFRKLL